MKFSIKRILLISAILVIAAVSLYFATSNVVVVNNNGSVSSQGQYTDVRAFGAKGDGVTDDTAAIQAAIDSSPPFGKLICSPGNYLLKSKVGMTELLLITKPIDIECQGTLIIDSKTPATCDVIRINPNMRYSDGEGYKISKLMLIPASGIPARHAVNLDITKPGQRLKNLIIEKSYFGPFAGKGIQVTNPINKDGFFTSVIRDNKISNGIYLNRAGDSIQIERNKLSGKNYGIYVDLVQGANSLLIFGNNITSQSGGVYVAGGETDIRIVYNNFETSGENTSADRAFVVLKGSGGESAGPMRTPTILNNTFMMLSSDGKSSGNSYVDIAVLVDNSRYTIIEGNTVIRQKPLEQTAWKMTNKALLTKISKNYVSSTSPDSGYIDSGIATSGVYNPIAFVSGFENYSSAWETASVFLTSSEIVHLTGAVKQSTGGNWTDGTTIFILPVGLRPKSTQRFTVNYFITNIGFGFAIMQITSGGLVSFYNVNGKAIDWVSFSGISFHRYQ